MKIIEDADQEPIELPRPPVAEKTQELLDDFEPLLTEDYEQFKREFLEWLLTEGRTPYRQEATNDPAIYVSESEV